MEQTKRNKILKTVGLISLTVIVLVGIFLGIYFTNEHNPEDKETINAYVKDVNAIKNGSFSVTNVIVTDKVGDKIAKEGKVYMILDMTFTATTGDLKVNKGDLNLSGFKPKTNINGFVNKNFTVKKGNSQDVKVVYEVKRSFKEHFLYCYGYRVKVGVSDIVVPLE